MKSGSSSIHSNPIENAHICTNEHTPVQCQNDLFLPPSL